MVVKINSEEAFHPISTIQNNTILTLATAVILIFAVSFFLTRSIARPIITLKNISDRIIAGDLTQRAPITSNNVIGELAISFNQMTDNLVKANIELEQKVLERTTELEQSNIDLQEFAYIASHDLQEPLRMIISFLQLLSDRYKGQLDEDADEFIQFAVDGSKRLENMIKDLLDYSRVDRLGNPFSETDLNQVIENVIGNLKVTIDENNVKVTYDPLPILNADSIQMISLFQNLIGNAIKFRSKEPPRIHISVIEEETAYCFSIKDNGIGIDSAYFNNVFVIFKRLHTDWEYPGTGIGLAVCKKIIERHGGSISVESEGIPGKGSTFSFTILK